MNKLHSTLILLILFLTACATSEPNTLQVQISPTLSPTPIPTNTLTPIPTPIPTNTPTITPTSSPTPIPTPIDPIVIMESFTLMRDFPLDGLQHTSLRKGIIGLVIGKNEDGTWYNIQLENKETGWVLAESVKPLNIEAVNNVSIALTIPAPTTPTVTPTPTPTQTPTITSTPTKTPIPTPTRDIRGDFETIDIRELESYANDHVGELVRIRGEVFNITGTFYQIYVPKPNSYDRVVVVVTYDTLGSPLPDSIYEDTWITVYGVVAGWYVGTNSFGGTIVQPKIWGMLIEK